MPIWKTGDPPPPHLICDHLRNLRTNHPVPEKRVTVLARIAAELGRPDIPLPVVEAPGTTGWLGRLGIDLSGVKSLDRMANTPDPRHFYRVTRAVLMPSVWVENGGLVARGALANGIPVLASDRDGLPETLGEPGFVFTLPRECTPQSGYVPTAQDVAPCVATSRGYGTTRLSKRDRSPWPARRPGNGSRSGSPIATSTFSAG